MTEEERKNPRISTQDMEPEIGSFEDDETDEPEAEEETPPARKPAPTRRERIRNYIVFFSVAWVLVLLAYGLGYVGLISSMGGMVGFWQVLVFISLMIVPLFALWGPYVMLPEETGETEQDVREREEFLELKRQLREVQAQLKQVSTSQEKLVEEMIPLIGTQASQRIRTQARRAGGVDDTPNLPLSERQGMDGITLDDISHVLNFSDRDQPGDWANAFALVSRNGKYLEFVRMAESVLEVFEQEGIYVEDISLRPATGEVWRAFAEGERGDEVASLEGVRDPSVLALVRARLRNDPQFHDLALRYQKRFIDTLEALSPDTVDADFVTLNKTRGGRLFVILGVLSGVFK